MRAKQRLGFLFYPLATEEEPGCPACGQPMDIAGSKSGAIDQALRAFGVKPAIARTGS